MLQVLMAMKGVLTLETDLPCFHVVKSSNSTLFADLFLEQSVPSQPWGSMKRGGPAALILDPQKRRKRKEEREKGRKV